MTEKISADPPAGLSDAYVGAKGGVNTHVKYGDVIERAVRIAIRPLL